MQNGLCGSMSMLALSLSLLWLMGIVPTRGMKHGDPLCPCLFLLCSEGLNGLIQHAINDGKIQGYSLCRGGPKISHLFFVDDSLQFCHAKLEKVNTIQSILKVYVKAFGQQINTDKTALFFGKSVSESTKNFIKDLLGVPKIKRYEKYLELLAVVGKNRRASLNYIKDRVWGKLQGWNKKLLSQVGKEVLLKPVVQAIPTFTMGCFKLPLGLCRDIEMLIRKFWWG